MPPRHRKPAQVQAQAAAQPTDAEFFAHLQQATHHELDFNSNDQPSTTSAPSTTGNEPTPAAGTKRKYVRGSHHYARPQEFDENGNRILPGHEYASLSLTGPRRKPQHPEPPPAPSLDPHGRPWLYPKKTRQGEGSNLAPFANEIKQWIDEGKSSKGIAELLIARGVETTDRHVAKQRLKMGFRQRKPRKLTGEAIANMRKAKQSMAKPLPTSGDVSVRRVKIREMRKAEITRMTKEGMSAADIAANLESRGINMRRGAPLVERLQKHWGLIGDPLMRQRHQARAEAAKRQKEQFTNLARELEIPDVDDWLEKKLREPDVVDARRRFAYALMGDAQPAIARASVEQAVKRSRRAFNKRQYFHSLKQAQAGDSHAVSAAAGEPFLQNTLPISGQSSTSQSTPQSGPPEAIEASGEEDGSEGNSEDSEEDEAQENDAVNSNEENDNDNSQESAARDEEEGEREDITVMANNAQQTLVPMELDSSAALPQQTIPAPIQTHEQNYSSSQNPSFVVDNPPSWAPANEQHLSAEGFRQAGFATLAPAPPAGSTQLPPQPALMSILPRPQNVTFISRARAAPTPQEPPVPLQPDSSLAQLPGEPANANAIFGPSRHPSREQADLMAQYGLSPYRTASRKEHRYMTHTGWVTTVGFEYLPLPRGAPWPIPAPDMNKSPQLSGRAQIPKYPPVVVPSVPVPPVVIPPEEAEKYLQDQKVVQDIQKKAEECMKFLSARASRQLLENSLTGLPPSIYDIQDAKRRLKEAVDAFFEAS